MRNSKLSVVRVATCQLRVASCQLISVSCQFLSVAIFQETNILFIVDLFIIDLLVIYYDTNAEERINSHLTVLLYQF